MFNVYCIDKRNYSTYAIIRHYYVLIVQMSFIERTT